MPRSKTYSEAIRREARELRQQGWSLKEIGDKFGAPRTPCWAGSRVLS